MPTARQTAGKLPGREALLSMLNDPDKTKFLTTLLSCVVLKDDLKIETAAQEHPSPGTWSLPGVRDVLLTRDGGIAVRVLADENLAAGTIVTAGRASYPSCRMYKANEQTTYPPYGVIFEDVQAGEMATVVIGGLGRVRIADDSE